MCEDDCMGSIRKMLRHRTWAHVESRRRAKDLMIQSPEDPEAFPQWAPGVNIDPIDSNTSQEIRLIT